MPSSSQEPHSAIKNDAERKEKGKKYALEVPPEDEVQREDDEETETEEDEDNDPHAKLIDELKLFQQWGLMNKRDPNEVSSSSDDDEEAPSQGQRYELDVTRRYPNFFLFIPQNPRYRGLLHDEGIKKTVHQSLWCKLVDLMDKALQTNCLSYLREIQEMMEEARV